MDFKRVVRHLLIPHWAALRRFPASVLKEIESAIARSESTHAGQLRFVVEGALHLGELWRGQSPRGRAVELFAQLRVWDTEHNSGVLIYLLLADKRVEIIADRGIHEKVGDAAWAGICVEMQRAFAAGRYEQGVSLGVSRISDLLAAHFPRREGGANELPDEPIVL
jgi:uncharacterized membrane protein